MSKNEEAIISEDHKHGYKLELYKSLRAEFRLYVDKVPGLWLQKFLLTGASLAFIVKYYDEINTKSNYLVIFAIFTIPILAILLDVRILEYGLHARAISEFIKKKFSKIEEVADWEFYLWGDQRDEDYTYKDSLNLIWFRTTTTLIATSVPTIMIIFLSGLVLSKIVDHIFWSIVLVLGTFATIVLYIVGTVLVLKKVWKQDWIKMLKQLFTYFITH